MEIATIEAVMADFFPNVILVSRHKWYGFEFPLVRMNSEEYQEILDACSLPFLMHLSANLSNIHGARSCFEA